MEHGLLSPITLNAAIPAMAEPNREQGHVRLLSMEERHVRGMRQKFKHVIFIPA